MDQLANIETSGGILSSLTLFSPELSLIFGAMISLILGAFSHNRLAWHAAFGFTALSILMCSSLPSSDSQLFDYSMSLDLFTIFGKMLLLCTGFAILLMTYADKKAFEMPVLIMLSLTGMTSMISASSLLVLYMGLELMSLPSYVLASFNRDSSRSTEAGLKYFIMGSIASGFFLLGATFVYGFTGTLSFEGIYDYYVALNSESDSITMPIAFLVGLVFIVVALSFKISAVPFHMWTPDVYQGSPTVITAFFASAPKVAGFIILIRILLDPFSDLYVQWQQVLVVVSIASMIIGSLGAIMQRNLKRLLAYSSIGHVGFILSGIVTAENEGIQGVLIYLSIYITMTVAAFCCILLLKREGRIIEDLDDLAGLSKSCPNTALAFTILVLSMAGVPPLAGFFAKFYILIPLIKAEMYSLAITFVITSVVAAFYYLRIVKIIYFDTEKNKAELVPSFALKTLVASGALFNLLYILAPTPLIKYAETASMVLFK